MPTLHDYRSDFRNGRTGNALRVNQEAGAYRSSVREAENMLVTADGRIKRRWGTQVRQTLGGSARLEGWQHADPDTSRFLMVFEDSKLTIYDMTLSVRATFTGQPWTDAGKWFFTIAFEGNTMIVADAKFQMRVVTLDVATATFSLATFDLTDDDTLGRLRAPFFAFADKAMTADLTIHTAAGQDAGYAPYIATALGINAADFDLTLGTGKLTTSVAYLDAKHVGTRLRMGTGELEITSVVDAQNATVTIKRDMAVKLDNNPFFIRKSNTLVEVAAQDHRLKVGDKVFFYGLASTSADKARTVLTNAVIFGAPAAPVGGAATYTVKRVVGPNHFEITGNATITDPDSLHGGSDVHMIPADGFTGVLEPAFSDLRGWPQACAIHETRLWLGGTDMLPDAVWASRLGAIHDFDPGEGNPQDALTMYGVGQQATVRHFVPGFDLMILCDNGEFYTPGSADAAIMQETARAIPASSHGASYTRPQSFDGAVFFLDAPGYHIRELILQEGNKGYQAPPASVVVPDWIKKPQHTTRYEGSTDDVTPYLIWGNMSDGALVVQHSSRADKAFGFMRWSLGQGDFVSAGAVGNRLFACARRNDGQHYLLEFDTEGGPVEMDFFERKYANPKSATHLSSFTVNETKQIVSARRVFSDVVIDAVGNFTTPMELSWAVIGDAMPWSVTMHAPITGSGQGPKIGKMQRLVSAEIHWDQTETGRVLDQTALSARDNPNFMAPTPVSEWREYWIGLWDREPNLVISGHTPGSVSIRAVVMNVYF